ncbi:MAG: GTPase [Chloroflexota bacterium]|nr:GTPase [Chloroflexota bacterium]
MPANLTPAYFEAEKRFRASETAEEKIEALNEMLKVMPKHKGTDGLRAELRTKIAKLTKEATKAQATSKRGGVYHIPKGGAGQIALVGLSNAGKSQLVSATTGASVEVADYPYTTKLPQLGMMKFDNVQIQLIDMPPITDHDARPWFAAVLRATDALLVVLDLEIDPVAEMQEILGELAKYRTGLIGIEDVSEEVLFHKKGIIAGNKRDLDSSGSNLEELKAFYGNRVPVLAISALQGLGLEDLRRESFDQLGVLRVYTKSPGSMAKMDDPMVLKVGSTIEEAAEAVHKDFRRNLKFALVWGSGRYPGQRVRRDHIVQDGDILELHT